MTVRLDSKSGYLTSEDDDRLVQSLPLAVDFHTCTALLEVSTTTSPATVHLQLAKPLRPEEPLYLWFSTDIQALLDISFLSPANIRGEKSYNCLLCDETFEYPNPLKVHIALDCGKVKLSQLWQRLKEVLDRSNNNYQSSVPYRSMLRLSLEPAAEREEYGGSKSPTHSSYSNPSPKREVFEETRPSSEPPRNSAFRPYLMLKNSSKTDNRQKICDKNSNQEDNINNESYMNRQAAEIEALVSNLGQSKQGHLCLYCGKIYSRKYGLKIHIRTHTGFKPLKCKYCLRPFGDPSNLNKHVRLHAESDTPYRCELCGKVLVRRRDLERHIKSRHNV